MDRARLLLTGNDKSTAAADAVRTSLAGTPAEKIANGERIVIFKDGTVLGDVKTFLRTDGNLSSAYYPVVYDAKNGLTVQVLKPDALAGSMDTSGLSASFLEWCALEDMLEVILGANSGLIMSAEEFADLYGNVGDPIIRALCALCMGDAGAVRSILDRLSPKSFAAMIAMPVEVFHGDVRSVSARLEQRRYDADASGWEFFAQAQTTSMDNDTATDAPTFDFDTCGVLAGADVKLDAATMFGVAVGAGTGKAKVHNGGGKIESTDCRALVYLGKTFADRFYVNAGAQVGFASYNVKRTTDFENINASVDGWNVGMFAEGGMLLTLSEENRLYAMPYAELAYMHAATNSFKERGLITAFDANSLSGDSLRARIGCEFSWSVDLAGTEARLGLDTAYSRELLDDEIDVDVYSDDGDDRFKISEKAKTAPTDVFSIGPTLNVALTKNMGVYAGYAFEMGTDSSKRHRANVGFRMRF